MLAEISRISQPLTLGAGMTNLTATGRQLIADIAQRYHLSEESALNMLISVNNGGGTMAQFSCPELGSGQWMQGGMTMVGDMFNYSLKNTVNNLCGELSQALSSQQLFEKPKVGSGSGNQWWPDGLGTPSSTGSQNNIRYAVFPSSQRLVVQRNGETSVFNTLNHQISGVSQQQGGDSSLTFTSQFGTISTLNIPMISGPGLTSGATNFASAPAPSPQAPSPAPAEQNSNQTASQDTLALLENLGKLRDAGILSDDEFSAKKSELLARI